MSLKQIRSFSVLFSDSEEADPNIIYEEPDDEASSSDKDVSDATFPARTTSTIFLFGFGQEGKNRYAAFYQSQADTPLLPRSAYRGRDAGGPEAGASWVGV